MEQSFLIQLLQILRPADWPALRKFVRSPFFNQKPEVVRLFDALQNRRNEPDSFDKETLFKIAAPEEPVYRHPYYGRPGSRNQNLPGLVRMAIRRCRVGPAIEPGSDIAQTRRRRFFRAGVE